MASDGTLSHSFPIHLKPSQDPDPTRRRTAPARYKGSKSKGFGPPPTKLELKWAFDKTQSGIGSLKKPTSVAFLKNGDLVVCETRKARIQVFDQTGTRRVLIDKSTDKFLERPSSVCTSVEGRMIVVADYNQVAFYDGHGRFKTKRPFTDSFIREVTSRGPSLFLIESGTTRAVVERTLDGQPKRKFKADYRCPNYVDANQANELVAVSDCDNHCVYIFDNRHKNPIRKIASRTQKTEERQLIWPSGISFNSPDTILVADKAHDVIAEYDVRGYYRYDALSEINGLRCPVGLSVSDKGKVAVTEELLDFNKDIYNLKLFSPISTAS